MEKYREDLRKCSFCCTEKDIKVSSFIENDCGVDNRILSIENCNEEPINFFKGTLSICFPKMKECVDVKDKYRLPASLEGYEVNVHGWVHNCNNEPVYKRFSFCADDAKEAKRIYCLLVAMANNQLVFDSFQHAKDNGIIPGQKWVVSGNDGTFGHEAGTQVVQVNC